MASAWTTLEAVNELLESIQQSPLFSYPSVTPSNDEVVAASSITRAVRQIQTEANFQFNWVEERSLTAELSGEILLTVPTKVPYAVARLDYTDAEKVLPVELEDRFVERNGKVYNATKETFLFAPSEVKKFKLTYWLDLIDLPGAAAELAVRTAKVGFVSKRLGPASEMMAYAERERMHAKIAFERDEHLRCPRSIGHTLGAQYAYGRPGPSLGPL